MKSQSFQADIAIQQYQICTNMWNFQNYELDLHTHTQSKERNHFKLI